MNFIFVALYWFLTIFEYILIGRVLLSWINTYNEFIVKLKEWTKLITEPFLQPIRLLIEKSIFQGNSSMFDVSPLIAFLLISALKVALISFIN